MTVRMTVRMDESLKNRLRQVAQELQAEYGGGIDMAVLIREAVIDHLRDYEENPITSAWVGYRNRRQ